MHRGVRANPERAAAALRRRRTSGLVRKVAKPSAALQRASGSGSLAALTWLSKSLLLPRASGEGGDDRGGLNGNRLTVWSAGRKGRSLR